jgi:hypothetical protein
MRKLGSPRCFLSLEIVPLLVVIFAFPASAQSGSDPNSAGTAGAQVQSESTAGAISSSPATAIQPRRTRRPILQPQNPNLSLEVHSLNPILDPERLAQPS